MDVWTKIEHIKDGRSRRLYEIDWRKYPVVVFESDDWGACQSARDAAHAALLEKLAFDFLGQRRSFESTLESPEDLRRLFSVLNSFKGADGFPASFTAFTCLSNPDFAKIKACGYSEFHEIGIDKGFPPEWERGDIVGEMRNGTGMGVWAPEYHSTLHHVSPVVLMEKLRSKTGDGELFRRVFESGSFSLIEHIPEYHGSDVRMQFEMVRRGMGYFRNAFGFAPQAAITSDAYPETETVWSLHGIRTIQLKTAWLNDDTPTVYSTKPWNNQDIYAKIGDYNPRLDVVYLGRNVFFEDFAEWPAEKVVPVIESRAASGAPAIVSTHRCHYTSLDKGASEANRRELAKLLGMIVSRVEGVSFLTTSELGQLYRRGCSLRSFGGKTILRVYAEDADLSEAAKEFSSAESVADGARCPLAPGMKTGVYIALK